MEYNNSVEILCANCKEIMYIEEEAFLGDFLCDKCIKKEKKQTKKNFEIQFGQKIHIFDEINKKTAEYIEKNYKNKEKLCNDNQIGFGKYRKRTLDYVYKKDINFFKHLSDYSNSFSLFNDEIKIKDKSVVDLKNIIKNKLYYMSSDITGISREEFWNALKSFGKTNQMKILLNYQQQFNLNQKKNKQVTDFSSIYLKLNREEIINKTRIFIEKNKICISCFKECNNKDYNLKKMHDSCYNEIKQQLINELKEIKKSKIKYSKYLK
jgi:hypothetical protein